MSNRRTLMAAAAIVLAAVAGIGVYMYASKADERAADDAGFVRALVATADIAKGTTGTEALQAGLVKFERVNRTGTFRLAQLAKDAGVRRLVYVSSLAVSGPTVPGRPSE